MKTTDWLLLVCLSVLWGGSFFLIEIGLQDFPPLTIVSYRVGLAAATLLVLVHAFGHRMPNRLRDWAPFLVMGVLNNIIPFSLITWGQVHIDSGLASILNAMTPIFTVLVAHVLTSDEKMTAAKLTGVGLGFLGVVALIGPAALANVGGHLLGQVAVLGAALSYAFAGIYGRRLTRSPSIVAAAGMLTASTILFVPITWLAGSPLLPEASSVSWAAVAGLALVSTAGAYLLYFRILGSAGATNVALVTFLVPVSALTLGILVLGERLDWTAVLGMAMIFLGLACVDGRLLRRLGMTKPPNALQ